MIVRRLALVAAALLLCAPGARAAGALCGDPCQVQVSTAGYVLPVDVITSGTTVVWTASSASHPTSDSARLDRCFLVSIGFGSGPGPVRFDVVGADLIATSYPGTAEESTAPCNSAAALPGGGFLLPFQCLIHPWMHGALLVNG